MAITRTYFREYLEGDAAPNGVETAEKGTYYLDTVSGIEYISNGGTDWFIAIPEVTWASLITFPDKKEGDRFVTTTANPADNIIYGNITLDGPNHFHYTDPLTGTKAQITII